MRILITGAGGNLGRGLVPHLEGRHELVLYDLAHMDTKHEFYQADIQTGWRITEAARGCDVLVHLAAWHGIHSYAKTEADFWRLNIDGTFHALQAAVHAGIPRVVYASSAAVYDPYGKYGFTKKIGEELLQYVNRRHQINCVSLRPWDFTPWRSFIAYGARMLRGGVDRRDVIDCFRLAIEAETTGVAALNVARGQPFTSDELAAWPDQAPRILDRHVPAASDLVSRYEIDISAVPSSPDISETTTLLGWEPRHDFLTFLRELSVLDAAGTVESRICDY